MRFSICAIAAGSVVLASHAVAQAPAAAPAATTAPAATAPAKETPKVKEIILNKVPGVAPEYQEAARKSQLAREKIQTCQKEATAQKILPRDRTHFVLACIDRKTD